MMQAHDEPTTCRIEIEPGHVDVHKAWGAESAIESVMKAIERTPQAKKNLPYCGTPEHGSAVAFSNWAGRRGGGSGKKESDRSCAVRGVLTQLAPRV